LPVDSNPTTPTGSPSMSSIMAAAGTSAVELR
jgi:hypothetical protein